MRMRNASTEVTAEAATPAKRSRHKKVRELVAADSWHSFLNNTIGIVIPLYTKPECNGQTGNSRFAGIVRSRTRKSQRAKVTLHLESIRTLHPEPRQLTVRMVRLSPGLLDTGNLWSALKATQDAVAAVLGVNDGPNSPVDWEVGQEKSKAYGVRLEFIVRNAV